MTFDPPVGERCNNCRFCISRKETKTVGFISLETVTKEKFACRRNAPTKYHFYNRNYGPEYMESIEVEIPNTHWCGEWKERTVENKI